MRWLEPLGAWPGRIETPGLVKRRLLVVAAVLALTITGYSLLTQSGQATPWSPTELEDLAGLPNPPVRFVPTEETGEIRQLSLDELRQLERIRDLIEHFPVPDAFLNEPGNGAEGGG